MGNWFSPNDPIIRASGDVSFDSYEGASLHIFAGGSVNIPGNVTITSPDTVANSIRESITLSDGTTVVNIDGNTQPTLDIRAGTTNFSTPVITGSTTGFSNVPSTEGMGTDGDISINSITNNGGLVFLTNQDRPNPALSGEITVGSIDTSSDKSESVISINKSSVQSASFTNTASSRLTGGEINLRARSLFLDGSQLAALTLGTANAGSVVIRAAESVSMQGLNSNNGLPSVITTQVLPQPEAIGNAGNLIIETERLVVANGAQISSSTFSFGNAGELKIVAKEVEVIGRLPNGQTPSSIAAAAGNAFISPDGNGARTTIEAERLVVANGAQITSSSFGSGDVGDLVVKATEIEVIGTGNSPNGEISSKLITQVEEGASGGQGNLTIESGHLLVSGGAQIGVNTFGNGDAGNLKVTADSVELIGDSVGAITPSGLFATVQRGAKGSGGNIIIDIESLNVTDGAQLSASTFSNGNAGNINVIADSVELQGTDAEGFPSTLTVQVNSEATGSGGDLTIDTKILNVTDGAELSARTFGNGDAGNIFLEILDIMTINGTDSGIFANTEEGSTGNGGSILTQALIPQTVIIRDSANIAVNSEGKGQGGNITLAAEELIIDNGSITAETKSNQGGNITLNIHDLLSFINSGEITTTAGTEQTGGDGGDIGINSDFIVGFPTQDKYRITAEAFEGDGGNIDITTNAIFGREFFEISASSELGLEGEISINTPDINPLQGLDNLPAEVVDASQLIAKRCLVGDSETAEQQSEFTITGRGGLPANPNESLRGEAVLSPEWVTLNSAIEEERIEIEAEEQTRIASPQIVQATGWVIRPNGKVSLIANNPNSVPSSPGINHPQCNAVSK